VQKTLKADVERQWHATRALGAAFETWKAHILGVSLQRSQNRGIISMKGENFMLLESLGAGSYGEVWKAINLNNGVPVCIIGIFFIVFIFFLFFYFFTQNYFESRALNIKSHILYGYSSL
jgi:hypothetical protein